MESTMEKFMSLSQERTVDEYCDEFKFLLNKVLVVEEISEDYATYLFIFSLKPEIGDILMGYHNMGKGLKLDQAFHLARLQESGMNVDSNHEITTNQLRKLDVGDSIFQHSNNSAALLDKKEGLGLPCYSQFIEAICAPKMFDEMPRKVINEIKCVLDDDSRKDEKEFDINQNEGSELYSSHYNSDSGTLMVMSNYKWNIEVFHNLNRSKGHSSWLRNNLNDERGILNLRASMKDLFSMLKNLVNSCYDNKEKDLNTGKTNYAFRYVVYLVEWPTISWDKTKNILLVYDGGGVMLSSNWLDFSMKKNQNLHLDYGKETWNMDEYVRVFRLTNEYNSRKKKKKQIDWIDTGWVYNIECIDDELEDTTDVSWMISWSDDADQVGRINVRLLRIKVNLGLWVLVVETYIGFNDWLEATLIKRNIERAKRSLIGGLSYSLFLTQVYLQWVYLHYDNRLLLHKLFFSANSYDLFAKFDMLRIILNEWNHETAKWQVELCTVDTKTTKLDALKIKIDLMESKSTNQEYTASMCDTQGYTTNNQYMLVGWG